MGRRFVQALSIISAVGFSVLLFLYVWSYLAPASRTWRFAASDESDMTLGGYVVQLASWKGALFLRIERREYFQNMSGFLTTPSRDMGEYSNVHSFLGFGIGRTDEHLGMFVINDPVVCRARGICFPLWMPLLLFSILPTRHIWRDIWRGVVGWILSYHVNFATTFVLTKQIARVGVIMMMIGSVVLCVLVVAFWIRSYWMEEALTIRFPGSSIRMTSSHSQIGVESYLATRPAEFRTVNFFYERGKRTRAICGNALQSFRQQDLFGRFGFMLSQSGYGNRYDVTTLVVPDWFVFIVGVIGAVPWLLTRKRKRTGRDGFCAKCGYDLCASIERCPECGTPVQTALKLVLR